ncbi:hypothetical protein E2C01_072608 [Portunus trituberculatus]|uniref:Uncharacterized protein n=1 Tax=Portunus trituberculatus TaxID=210409 RepID=A0A5B7IB71_PORTR|nr:hypothetical protein [Portunus trituberculatus]
MVRAAAAAKKACKVAASVGGRCKEAVTSASLLCTTRGTVTRRYTATASWRGFNLASPCPVPHPPAHPADPSPCVGCRPASCTCPRRPHPLQGPAEVCMSDKRETFEVELVAAGQEEGSKVGGGGGGGSGGGGGGGTRGTGEARDRSSV